MCEVLSGSLIPLTGGVLRRVRLLRRPDSFAGTPFLVLSFLARHPATIDPSPRHENSKEVTHAYLYHSVTVDRSGYS